jgi:hypothetical protein
MNAKKSENYKVSHFAKFYLTSNRTTQTIRERRRLTTRRTTETVFSKFRNQLICRAKAAFLDIDENEDDEDSFFSVKTKSKSQLEKEDKEFQHFNMTTGKEVKKLKLWDR